MKINYLIISFLVFALCAPVSAQYWEKVTAIQPPYGQNYYLDIYFLPNGQNGWACGYNGAVIRTSDGGDTWAGSTVLPGLHLESIHFVDVSTGFTSGVAGIWKSQNGGLSWINISPTDTNRYWGCYFVDANVGMVVGEGCSPPYKQNFWRTTDGGATWSLFQGDAGASGLTDVILSTPGGEAFATSSGIIWRSTDGGQAWSIFASSGSNVWQEELTKSGSSFLVPYAGSTCGGGGGAGGMRFSDDNGGSWKQFSVGMQMFGAFLTSPGTGWGCGFNGAIYYTSNAGDTWHKFNCGTDGEDFDDLWFISGSKGFVVGEAIYKYVPEKVAVNPDILDFGEVCIPYYEKKELWIKNLSFYDRTASATLKNNPDGVFQIVYPPNVSFPVNACDSQKVQVRYQPLTPAEKTATLEVIMGGKVFNIPIIGKAYELTAKPDKFLIDFDSVKAGYPYRDTLRWSSDSDGEGINDVKPDSGSSDFLLRSGRKQAIHIDNGARFIFEIVASDTGFVAAKYIFNVYPCDAIVEIRMKAYGISPIINADTEHNLTLECSEDTIYRIPVYNTGNSELLISNISLSNTDDYTIIGWAGSSEEPKAIQPGEYDTLIIGFKPLSPGEKGCVITLENNDYTTARGPKSPYLINITGAALAVRLSSDSTVDFGAVCIGDSVLKEVIVKNGGELAASLLLAFNSGPWKLTQPFSSPHDLAPGDSLIIELKFKPTESGAFNEFISFYDRACGDSIHIRLTGTGISASMEVTPQKISGALQTKLTEIFNITATNTGNEAIEITNATFNPPLSFLEYELKPGLPVTAEAGETVDFELSLTSQIDTSFSTNLCFEGSGVCPLFECVELEFDSQGKLLELSTDSIHFGELRCPGYIERKFLLINNGAYPDSIIQIRFAATGPFRIQNINDLPEVLQPGDSVELVIWFKSIVEGEFEYHLTFVTRNGFIEEEITIKFTGSYSTVKTTKDKDFAEFGLAEACEEERKITVTFENEGSYNDTLEIIRSGLINGFRADPGDFVYVPAGGEAEIFVYANPPEFASPGDHYGEIVLQSAICGKLDTITAHIMIARPRLTWEPQSLEFGSIWPGEEKSITVTLKNETEFDKTVSAAYFSPFVPYISHRGIFPKQIKSGSDYSFIVSYKPEEMGEYSNAIYIIEESACIDTISIPISAESPEEKYISQVRAGDYEADFGDILNIEIEFIHNSENFEHDLSVLSAKGLYFRLEFDNNLFIADTLFVKTPGGMKAVDFAREFGSVSVNLGEGDARDILQENGVIFIIKGRALASIPDETILDITGFEPDLQKNLEIVKIDGSLKVGGFCKSEIVHKIGIVVDPGLTLKENVIRNNSLKLHAQEPDGQEIHYELISPLGQNPLKGSIIADRADIEIPMNGLPSGAYFLKAWHFNRIILSEKIIIFR